MNSFLILTSSLAVEGITLKESLIQGQRQFELTYFFMNMTYINVIIIDNNTGIQAFIPLIIMMLVQSITQSV